MKEKGPRMTTNKVSSNCQRGLLTVRLNTHTLYLEKSRKLLHKRQRQEQESNKSCVAQVIAREERRPGPRKEAEAVSVVTEVFV